MRVLFSGFDLLATFDSGDGGSEIGGGDVLVDEGVIAAVGVGLARTGIDRLVDCSGLVGLPGLINSHQHLYQGAFRAVPEFERSHIGPWLGGLSGLVKDRWKEGRFGPDQVRAVAAAVLAESVLGGQTTVADQHYFFPGPGSDAYIEATIDAALQVGVRLHACRGSITAGPDPETTQSVDEVVRHCQFLIDHFHDPSPEAMVRVALAPCGVHVDRPELFDELAGLAAADPTVRLHTHLYERIDTEVCRDRYGCSPWEFLVEHGWAQPGTWIAHVTDPPPSEIDQMAQAGVSVSHLIAPDLRMGWGVAPVREMLDAGVTVGFGTTGSASNDGANLLGDLRVAWLSHRYGSPESWLSARELLALATRGSAACLGRPELGSLQVGAAADLAAWDMQSVDRIGVHDPLIGLLATGLGARAALVVCGGRILVERGQPVAFDPELIAARARAVLL